MDYLTILYETLQAYSVLIESGWSEQAFHSESPSLVIFRRIGGKA
jgi:hypothetical protein